MCVLVLYNHLFGEFLGNFVQGNIYSDFLIKFLFDPLGIDTGDLGVV